MSKIVAVNDNLILEMAEKSKKRQEGSPFITAMTSLNLGIVRESSNPEYPVGTRVYFRGASAEKFFMNGNDVIAVFSKDVICKELE